MARPTIMTPEIITKLEEAFMLGCGDLEACLYADIGKSTLYNYQEKHPEFVDRKEQLKENPILKARTSVIAGLQNSPELALKFLERRKKDEFSTSADVNLGGQKDNPVVTTLAESDRAALEHYFKTKGLKDA
jgi:hypothetical protein